MGMNLTPQQRAALATCILFGSTSQIPTSKIARMVGLKRRATQVMLRNLEQVIPIELSWAGWRWMRDEESQVAFQEFLDELERG